MRIEPVTLDGKRVRLEPLSLDHLSPLCEIGLDMRIWKMTTPWITTREQMRDYIETALKLQSAGSALPFATFDKVSGRFVGSTRYGNISTEDKRVEIGWTWIAPDWQRTHINTEAKYLLFKHAFETLGCGRVELKTDALNEKSRNAILRIGAKQEGILRKHMLTPSGRIRDTVYFSVIDEEWPAVKSRLQSMIDLHQV
jgi:N-acetyltransferase